MGQARISRRGVLRAGLATACSAAAHPWMSRVTLAAAPWDARLVVIVLRGGLDGLHLLQPQGDPDYARLRPTLAPAAAEGALPLDGFYALHSGAGRLKPLWDRGELGFVQAVSTPYRDKRSHFDGQDILEAGTPGLDPAGGAGSGWLNRLVAEVPGALAETAYAVGYDELKILNGPAEVLRWSPEADIELTPQAELLLGEIYRADPLFSAAGAAAMDIARRFDAGALPDLPGGGRRHPAAAFAAERLLEETRIAAFSVTGWDTHSGQERHIGRTLATFQSALLSLRDGLGPVWDKTAVLGVTEFGRTAAENGSRGTDHGTGGAMVLAGGALRGGRVHGDWPGLSEAALYRRRDLMPTADLRAYCAWTLRGLFGIERSLLERTVFPGLDMGRDPGLVV